MRLLVFAAGLLALCVAMAFPARAQWAIQRLDQYNTVTTDPRTAVVTEAFVNGPAGWRMRLACAPGAQFVLMLGRANMFGPPFGSPFYVVLDVRGPNNALLASADVHFQWARGSYEAVIPAAVVSALASGTVATIIGGGRALDRFGLAGSAAAFAALRPCQPPRAQAAAPAPTGVWRFADHDGVAATATVTLTGDRTVTFYCNPPNEARFRAWARQSADRNHVAFISGRFVMTFSKAFWPELAGRSVEQDATRRLTLLVGARRLEGEVSYDGLDLDFHAPVQFDSPLLGVLAEGEQAGERLILQEGARVLAAVPLQGATAAIRRARAFCGGTGQAALPPVASPAPPPPAPPPPAHAAPAAPVVALERVIDPALARLDVVFQHNEVVGMTPWIASPWMRTHGAEPHRTVVAITVYDLDAFGARGDPAGVREIDRYAASFVQTGNGFVPQFPRVRRAPRLIGMCVQQTHPSEPRALVNLVVFRRPAPGQYHEQASLPFAVWADPTAAACEPALALLLREQGSEIRR